MSTGLSGSFIPVLLGLYPVVLAPRLGLAILALAGAILVFGLEWLANKRSAIAS